jgi:hypothetical protein
MVVNNVRLKERDFKRFNELSDARTVGGRLDPLGATRIQHLCSLNLTTTLTCDKREQQDMQD